MPIIYRIEVSDEAKQSGMDPSLAGVVTFDGKKTGKVMPGQFQALLVGDIIEPLPHPVEWTTLRAHNENYLSASLKGVLLEVEHRICLQCGHTFGAPRLVFAAAAGCLPALLVATILFSYLHFVLGMATGDSFFKSMGALIAVVLIVQLAGTLYVQVRFSERQTSIQQRQCPRCHATDCASVSSIAGKRVPIGTEGKWVQVSSAGRS